MTRVKELTKAILGSGVWFLRWQGYDLVKGSGGLIGLSNSLELNGTPAIQTDVIQAALKLPRDYNEDTIREIQAAISAGGSDTRNRAHNE